MAKLVPGPAEVVPFRSPGVPLELVELDELPVDNVALGQRRFFGVRDRILAIGKLAWLAVGVSDHTQGAAIAAEEDRAAHR
jgi:hypothetical protein